MEAKIINEVSSTIYISEVDANTVPKEMTPGHPRHVIPNGVSVDSYTPIKNSSILSPNIGFLGNMGYKPNIEAVHWLYREVFLCLKEKFPDLSLVIIGRDPVDSILQLGDEPNVIVTGTVDEIWGFINSVEVFVFPLWIGGGVKNKILEVMYCGRPVVTTEIGNEGIGARSGDELFICNTTEEFIHKIDFLMSSPDDRDKMGKSGNFFVREKFSWDNILIKFESLLVG